MATTSEPSCLTFMWCMSTRPTSLHRAAGCSKGQAELAAAGNNRSRLAAPRVRLPFSIHISPHMTKGMREKQPTPPSAAGANMGGS